MGVRDGGSWVEGLMVGERVENSALKAFNGPKGVCFPGCWTWEVVPVTRPGSCFSNAEPSFIRAKGPVKLVCQYCVKYHEKIAENLKSWL